MKKIKPAGMAQVEQAKEIATELREDYKLLYENGASSETLNTITEEIKDADNKYNEALESYGEVRHQVINVRKYEVLKNNAKTERNKSIAYTLLYLVGSGLSWHLVRLGVSYEESCSIILGSIVGTTGTVGTLVYGKRLIDNVKEELKYSRVLEYVNRVNEKVPTLRR